MTLRMGLMAAAFAALAAPAGAVPLTMSIALNGGDGSVVVSEPPGLDLQVDIVGSNSGEFPFGPEVETLVSFVYNGAAAITLAGAWAYETFDHPAWDIFGYFIENVLYDVTDHFGGSEQSGNLNFDVNPGETFGFYIYSSDNYGGRASATVTIAEGVFPVTTPDPSPSIVPLPASAALLLPALGALGLFRRKAKAKG